MELYTTRKSQFHKNFHIFLNNYLLDVFWLYTLLQMTG